MAPHFMAWFPLCENERSLRNRFRAPTRNQRTAAEECDWGGNHGEFPTAGSRAGPQVGRIPHCGLKTGVKGTAADATCASVASNDFSGLSKQLSRGAKHVVEHLLSEHSGKRVLLAGVIAP